MVERRNRENTEPLLLPHVNLIEKQLYHVIPFFLLVNLKHDYKMEINKAIPSSYFPFKTQLFTLVL